MWFLNRGDGKAPPIYPLEPVEGRKQVTVAVVVNTTPGMTSVPDFATLDRELATQIGKKLSDETREEEVQVKVIDQSTIQQFKKNHSTKWSIGNRSDVAKELGADYLIDINLTKFSLYSPETGREICNGHATAEVAVYAADGSDAPKYQYGHTTPPQMRDGLSTSPQQYRLLFINRVATEIAYQHIKHIPERDRGGFR